MTERYGEFDKEILVRAAPLKVICSAIIKENGMYMIVFKVQAVNDSKAAGKATNIMVTAKLFINGVKNVAWTENVDPIRHYGCPSLVKPVLLFGGDVVEIKMRADSSQVWPAKSVFILKNQPDRMQFDVIKMDGEKI